MIMFHITASDILGLTEQEEIKMEWMQGLQKAVDYIEDHLEEEIDFAVVAAQAYSSNFHFQRVFHIICGYSLGEYIRNRRLSLAGSELSAGGSKVIDTALKYGYNSPESFSRAFTKFHGVTPQQAKTGTVNLKSFSRVSVKLILEGGTAMDYRIEKREAFQVIARKERYGRGEEEITQKTIQATWAECIENGSIESLCRYVHPENLFGDAIIGISIGESRGSDFDYAIGAVYTGGDVAKGLTVEEIPAATWAVFPCTGSMPEAFKELWKKIYTEFFPASKYQPVGGICIEVYPSAEVHDPDYHCEFWLTVEEK